MIVKRIKKISYSFILVIVSSIISLFIIEIIIRTFLPQQESMRWFQSSEKYGYVTKKNFSQNYKYVGYDFVMNVKTNSFGHRHEEYNQSDFTNKNIKKILLLGDSFLFGYGVNMENHMATHLTNMLNKSTNRFSIINAGVGGWGTLNEISYAKDHFELFNPDIIVILFCGNDLKDDIYFLNNMQDNDKGLFYFPGKLFIKRNLHLYRFLYYKYHVLLHNTVLKKKLKNNKDLFMDMQSKNTISSGSGIEH